MSWWRQPMETFSGLLALCEGNPPLRPVDSPHKGQWRGDLMFSLMCTWKKNGWASNRDADDLRRHGAHCDVTVMRWQFIFDNAITRMNTMLLVIWATHGPRQWIIQLLTGKPKVASHIDQVPITRYTVAVYRVLSWDRGAFHITRPLWGESVGNR